MDGTQITWLIRRHLPEVCEIERQCFPDSAWTEDDFLSCLRQRNMIGTVAGDTFGVPVGFMIYELHKDNLRVVNFAVHPDAQRRGVGSKLLDRLKEKLSQQRRRRIVLEVREGNLPAQLFFRSQGFRAECVLRGWYDRCTEDAYRFVWRLPVEAEPHRFGHFSYDLETLL